MTVMEAWKITSLTDYGIVKIVYDILEQRWQDPSEPIPILPTEAFAKLIDNYYYFAWSGDKFSSPLVEKLSKIDEEHMPAKVAAQFYAIHGDELIRQWQLFQKEYDPLASYDVHEVTEYEHEGSGSVEDSGSDTRKKTGKVSTTDSAWGLNSSVDVDADKSVTEYGEGQTPMQDELQYGKTRESSESASDDLTIHKYGNLGNISLTKLLKEDVELWSWDFFTKFFFPAIDSVIALPIY